MDLYSTVKGVFVPYDLHTGLLYYQKAFQVAKLDEKSSKIELIGPKIVLDPCLWIDAAHFLRLEGEAQDLVLIVYRINTQVCAAKFYEWPSLDKEFARLTYEDASQRDTYLSAFPKQVDDYLYLICTNRDFVSFLPILNYYTN